MKPSFFSKNRIHGKEALQVGGRVHHFGYLGRCGSFEDVISLFTNTKRIYSGRTALFAGVMATMLGAMALMGCKDTSKSSPAVPDDVEKNATAQVPSAHPGKGLLESECFLCHDPKASMETMIAPPMAAVKRYYMDSTTSKKEFTEAIIAWVNNPEQASKMPGALQRFGSMPYVPYEERTLTKIAEYLYENDIEKPHWFRPEDGYDGEAMDFYDSKLTERYVQIGLEYANAAQAHLGKNLLKALQEKGPVGAVQFCNLKASELTDSISLMNNAVIKRVTDKPRNPENKANAEEMGYLSYFAKLVAAGKTPQPLVKTDQGEVHFYYPITTNAMCLQCHGRPQEEVMPNTLTVLRELYPNDKALGYGANEVRGLWSVNFDANSLE